MIFRFRAQVKEAAMCLARVRGALASGDEDIGSGIRCYKLMMQIVNASGEPFFRVRNAIMLEADRIKHAS